MPAPIIETTDAPNRWGPDAGLYTLPYAPNGLALILLGDIFYSVHAVHSSDVLGVSITFDCSSLPSDEAPPIRMA